MKTVNRHVYTPLSERPKDALGRTAASRRRKARALGFKSEADLLSRVQSLNDLGQSDVSLGLLLTFSSEVKEPYNAYNWARLSRRKHGVSPRQFRKHIKFVRKACKLREAMDEVCTGAVA